MTASAAPATPAQQAEWCKRLTARLPGVTAATCQRSALMPSGANSLNGFLPILVREIPAVTTKSPISATRKSGPVRIFLLGGIHGDELTAASIVFQ